MSGFHVVRAHEIHTRARVNAKKIKLPVKLKRPFYSSRVPSSKRDVVVYVNEPFLSTHAVVAFGGGGNFGSIGGNIEGGKVPPKPQNPSLGLLQQTKQMKSNTE